MRPVGNQMDAIEQLRLGHFGTAHLVSLSYPWAKLPIGAADVIGRRERLSPIRSSGSKLEQILKWFSGAPRRFRARLRLSADLQALGNPG